jgi:hypothetical protein
MKRKLCPHNNALSLRRLEKSVSILCSMLVCRQRRTISATSLPRQSSGAAYSTLWRTVLERITNQSVAQDITFCLWNMKALYHVSRCFIFPSQGIPIQWTLSLHLNIPYCLCAGLPSDLLRYLASITWRARVTHVPPVSYLLKSINCEATHSVIFWILVLLLSLIWNIFFRINILLCFPLWWKT